MTRQLAFTIRAIVNSYAILFFSQNKVLGVLLLLVSFFNPAAGAAGLACLLFSLALVSLLNYDRESIGMGFYSFNSLLLGIGFGTFYRFNLSFFIWLSVACILVTMLSVILATFLGKRGFPLLSLPFVITFWLVLSAVNSVYQMGLEQSNSAIINEMYTAGEGMPYRFPGALSFVQLPSLLSLFFRALSAVLFQNNVVAGVIISLGLIIHSRIMFSLIALAFISACLLNGLTYTYPDGISYYHLGSNVVMASAALGSFFLIPSLRSYLWAMLAVPVIFVLINAATKIFGMYDLPVLSLPFCTVIVLFLSFFRLRAHADKLTLTPLQHYSPERNLYQYLNGKERLEDLKYFNLHLPFMGVWSVSQGYDGDITHKREWGKALDFVIKDEDQQTYQYPGTRLEHFYCFNKPVLACGDGIIEEVVDHVADNEIGQVNLLDNWGNSVVIKHLTGLYSKVSHLKQGSVKVKPGDVVKQGDVLGMCGSSGRSPEPHLHFQVQTTPYIGSKTLIYPFAYYLDHASDGGKLQTFKVPREGAAVSQIAVNATMKQAFKFQPGYMATVTAPGNAPEHFEVLTDAWNQTYIYSKTMDATAYFVNNGTSFYFTSYYGNQKSLLYYFYLAAYKIVFTADTVITVKDIYPTQLMADKATLWLQDILAPFYQFVKLTYQSHVKASGWGVAISSSQTREIFGQSKTPMEALLELENGTIKAVTVTLNDTKIEAQWITESTY